MSYNNILKNDNILTIKNMSRKLAILKKLNKNPFGS